MVASLSSLANNEYFSAGFGLVGLTSFLAILRRGAIVGGRLMMRRYTTSLEINKNDRCYEWILDWLSKNNVSTTHKSVSTVFYQTETGNISTEFIFPPAQGIHYFKFKGRIIKVERSKVSGSMVTIGSGGNSNSPHESINMTVFGRSNELFETILKEAHRDIMARNIGKTITYIPDSVNWRTFGHPKCLRSIESVILDAGIIEELLLDINEFVESHQWYKDRGIPYRRAYLLHGPPGCGKTSLITALAGKLRYNICQLGLGDAGLTDERLQFLLNTAPLQSLIVLEDIDLVNIDAPQKPNRLTRSGVLNTLDGISSSEQRIIFMTTNYIDRLDSTLLRAGRCDKKVYIGFLSNYQLRQMVQKFYSGIGDNYLTDFVSRIDQLNLELSPAQLQGYLLRYKEEPTMALKNIKKLTTDSSI